MAPLKADSEDYPGRFREIISDPLNLLIERVPEAGTVSGTEVCLHNGNWVPLAGEGAYYGDFSGILVLNRGVHEPLEEYVFQEILKRLPVAPTMVELGAYWAHYSMWLQKVRPQSKVFLVEPDQTALDAGRNNFRRNGFKGEFISATVAKGAFQIDEFLERSEIQHVDILHCDIQGFEMQMLEGAVDALAGTKFDYLFVSTHSQELHAQVVGMLERNSYRVEVSSDFDNETTSFDGFVFASSPRATLQFQRFRPLGRTKIADTKPSGLLKSLLSQLSEP
jgi:Methyltransferase FkbM domain